MSKSIFSKYISECYPLEIQLSHMCNENISNVTLESTNKQLKLILTTFYLTQYIKAIISTCVTTHNSSTTCYNVASSYHTAWYAILSLLLIYREQTHTYLIAS